MSRLVLGNVPHSATEAEICYWAQSLGFIIESVEIIKDRFTGRHRGFCFVNLADEQKTDAAVKTLNGKIMRGRLITVNHAVPLRAAHRQEFRRSA
jgi:RNA recognition motif-containing protein